MNKYILYRIGMVSEDGEDNEDQEMEELVAVEFGDDLDGVLEDILRDVRDDLSGMSEYEKCDVDVHGPTEGNYNNPPFNFLGVVLPPSAEKNILVDYTVEVEEQ